MTKFIVLNSQYLRNNRPDQVEIWGKAETINYTLWVVYHCLRANPTRLTAAIMKIAMTLYLHRGSVDSDEIW